MRDLELFQRLRNGDRRSPELLTALGELCEIGTRDRVPYFGSLVGLVEDEAVPVEIRNAALRALVGANGWMTVEAVVHALDEPSLREAALDVLRFVIETDPKRWVHAAFHRDPDVRRLALSGRRTPRVDPIEFYLLADPECRALLRDREPAVPRAQLTTLLDFVRAGHVTKNDARAMFARSPSVLETSLDAMRRRLPELVTQLLVGARSAPGFDAELARAHPDDLDTFLEVLPPEDTRAMRELSRLARNGHFEERLAVSAWASVASHDSPPKTTVELLYGLDPLSIAGASIPVAVAREVLTEMARWPGAFPHLSAELAGPLLALPVVTHPEGGIDLAVAGAIVQLVAKDGYTLAGSHLGMNAIVAALDARLEASLPFFYSATAKDGDPGARAILARLDEPRQPALPGLDAVAPEPAPPVSQKDVLVAMAEHAHHSRWQLLASAGAESLGHVLVRVGKSGVDADRSAKLAALAAKTLSIGALPRIVGPLLGDEEPSLEVTPPEPRLLFASAVLGAVSAVVESPVFVERFLALPPKSLFTALGLLGMAGAFQWPKELALADALLGHRDPRIARWAAERMPAAEVEVPRPPPRPGAGVAYRTPPPSPSVEACVLLLGSADPIGATDAAFPQWASDAPAFLAELDAALVNEFAHRDVALSPLGHAWLWRWDRHALAHFSLVLAAHESLAEGVRARSALTTRILRDSSIAAIASALMLLSFQNRPLLREVLSHDLVDALIDLLPGDAGESAADALRAIHRAQELDMRDALTKIRILLPDLAEGVRDRLGRLVDSSGLPPRRVQRAPEQGLAEEVLERIRTSVDLDALVRDTEDERMNVVHEATLRLIELGADGLERLAAIVVSARSCDRVRPIIESVPLWPEGPALALLEEHLRTEELAAEIRFRLAIAFAERHEPGAIDIAIAATLSSGDDRWFEPRDWDAMLRFVDSAKLSRSLAASPHPHAHVRALEWLLALPAPSENLDALRAFLATGTKRMGSLRRRAARVLLDEGDDSAFPLVLTQELEEATGRSTLLVSAGDDLVDLTATSILAAGTALAKEAALLRHLASISLFRAEPAFEIILRRGTVDKARIAAAGALSRGMSRERKLLKVVSTFSWGGRVGQRLLGKRMRVKMTGSQKLGFTRTRENVVYVSPLPMLRGDRQGTEIVEGLILHELGHHLYHAGPANEAVWETAKKEGIGGLLNLVADEHLERNMRAIDSEYGDKLKRLAAYAFQHNGRPIEVSGLLRHVGARAAEVIPQVHLGVARDPTTVLVESGSLLFLMERAGLSFVRFARALRMGLGNRHADPPGRPRSRALRRSIPAFQDERSPRGVAQAPRDLRLGDQPLRRLRRARVARDRRGRRRQCGLGRRHDPGRGRPPGEALHRIGNRLIGHGRRRHCAQHRAGGTVQAHHPGGSHPVRRRGPRSLCPTRTAPRRDAPKALRRSRHLVRSREAPYLGPSGRSRSPRLDGRAGRSTRPHRP